MTRCFRPGPLLWLVGAMAGLMVAGRLAFSWSLRDCPVLPEEIRLRIAFPAADSGTVEPLIAGGTYGRGDFLTIAYGDDRTLVFRYDYWGRGGPHSTPFQFVPGQTYDLRVRMPALAAGETPGSGPAQLPLLVECDGRVLLDMPAEYHSRPPAALYFGIDAIGGSTVGEHFTGRVTTPDGRPLPARVADYVGRRKILGRWLRARPWEAATVMVLGFATGALAALLALLVVRAVAGMLRRAGPLVPRTRRSAAAAWISIALATLGFAWIVTQETWALTAPEPLGDFFDYQAESLWHGRLDVPEPAIGNEAFEFQGRHYGYFGLTPALWRMPLLRIWPGLHGHLTRLGMIAYFALCLAASWRLLAFAAQIVGGPAAKPSPWATVLFLLSIGLGSSLYVLGSRVYVYHEAILCGAALALWAAVFALRYLHSGSLSALGGSWLLGVLAVNARPPAGVVAFGILGAAALARVVGANGETRRRAAGQLAALAALCAVGMASANMVSYGKFRTFDLSPLRYSVQYDAARLARFEGKNFHLSNVPMNAYFYFIRPEFHWTAGFPYFHFGDPDLPPAIFPEARFDRVEPTLAVPDAMPALFLLAIVGGAWAALAAPRLRGWLAAAGLSLLALALALFCAVYVSHRYTADFCPALVALAAPALAVMDASPAWRRPGLLAFSLLTALSLVISVSLAFQFQADLIWGGAPQVHERFHHFCSEVDGWMRRTF